MRNPLHRRLLRELKSDLAKYIILFVFMVSIIGFISGFFVAAKSIEVVYDEGFEKHNIEDGNFEYYAKAEKETLETIEKEGVQVYENFYIERETDDFESKLRLYENRTEVDRVCLMEGAFPETESEVAIDRMYADNNKIAVGDTIIYDGTELTVSGLVALSDYSSLFADTSSMMFDAMKFGVGVVTEEGFESLGEAGIHYNYSWTYNKKPADKTKEKEMSEDLLEVLAENGIMTNFIPQYLNQAIVFTDEDMGSDRIMFSGFLYIVIAIIAFIFAVTTSNTIAREATVIGTLRASGYTKGEIIRHYITLPVAVTVLSAIVGNILGYTVFLEVAKGIYYTNYSLPTFELLFNWDAFLRTTVVPVISMILINYVIIAGKLKLSPMKFLRRDLSVRQKKKAFKLNTKIGIMKRFRLRIIFQNMPNYLTLIFGVFFANLIMILGMAFPALMERHQEIISENIVSAYQYILKAEAETETEGAEKYAAGTLVTTIEGRKEEAVSLYGVDSDSQYVNIDFEKEEVYISSAFSEKYGYTAGDTVTLKEEFDSETYDFKVAGIYEYPVAIAVFMPRDYYNEVFEHDENYFNGYFSNEKIEDIDDMLIAATITEDDINKMSRQLSNSMGGVFDIFYIFGLVMFALIIFLLSKLVIEKNAQSISMTKILGYTDREIGGLYILTTSIVVIASFILTMPLVDKLMATVIVIMLSDYAGWIPYYVPMEAFIKISLAGIAVYAVIAWMQFEKVKKVPLDVALKTVE
ncbi:MAG: ABC transporter permease [Lachnospiraceae bacterium]|nr:ABC transporter permease [Lachnospiraceae bacterium]